MKREVKNNIVRVKSVYSGDVYFTSPDQRESFIDGVPYVSVATSMRDFEAGNFKRMRKDSITKDKNYA